MSTPTQLQNQFGKDLDGLNTAAQAYTDAQDQLKKAEEVYRDSILAKLDGMKSAEGILMYLITAVFQNSAPPSSDQADASILGIFGDKAGLKGKALSVHSCLTAVHNDLQKMVNSGSNDPVVVHDVAIDLDQILDGLKNNAEWANAIDPTSLSNMQTTDTALRSQIYDATDREGSTYNPTDDSFHFYYNPGSGNPNLDKYLTNFGDMQKYMKEPGDKFNATEAYKSLSDNFNADTSMMQTVNSAVNEQINQLTSFIKTLLGFYQNTLIQPLMKLNSLAITNAGKG